MLLPGVGELMFLELVGLLLLWLGELFCLVTAEVVLLLCLGVGQRAATGSLEGEVRVAWRGWMGWREYLEGRARVDWRG